VFLLGLTPISDEQRLLAATLATSAVVSHASAGWLAGLLDRPPSEVHVLGDRTASHRREGIVVHRVAGLLPSDRTRLRGIPSTSPTRTLLDLAGMMDETTLRATVHRLVIEGDGFGVHGGREAFESDRERQNLLVLDGWRILRFTWRQIVREPAWVAAQIRAALAGSDRSRDLK
jgi:hypothetical protein